MKSAVLRLNSFSSVQPRHFKMQRVRVCNINDFEFYRKANFLEYGAPHLFKRASCSIRFRLPKGEIFRLNKQ